MKLMAGFLLTTLLTAASWAQIPAVVQHVQDQMNDVQQQKKAASDAALNNNAAKASTAKPAAATAAKSTAAVVVKPATPAQKAAASAAPAKAAAAKPATANAAATAVASKSAAPKPAQAAAKHDPFAKGAPKVATKSAAPKTDAKPQSVATAAARPEDSAPAESKEEQAEKKKESGYITAGNRRDPFVSPIVQHMSGSGCSTGKRCLAIDQIALRGIVKSDGGMIAVVVNSVDKAYFLRENDPVFNGYVLKISGDSVVFKETVQDKLGHLSTREVVKKITTPAV